MDINHLKIIQTIVHYSCHFIVPFFIAYFGFRVKWKYVYTILIATMFVDLDHLFANPIFDPCRCSVGFHYLHSYYAIFFYIVLYFSKNATFKYISIGLLFHMATDFQDCLWISYINSLTK